MYNLTDLTTFDSFLNDLIELEASSIIIDDVNPSLDDYLEELESWELN